MPSSDAGVSHLSCGVPTHPKLESVELERCVELGRRGVALELQGAALEHQTCPKLEGVELELASDVS